VSSLPDHGHVRIAWTADTEGIGRVQARVWAESYRDVLPRDVLDELVPEVFASAWREAIERPPTARHRVLVTLDGGNVVGFAATAPSDSADATPGADGEIVAFHVVSEALGTGPGFRLLAACADALRADGFRRGEMWVLSADDALRQFLTLAGWSPDGAHRTLDLHGDGTTIVHQVRLHTDLAQAA
jgi:GNAT superfamily N-acetyltransferase